MPDFDQLEDNPESQVFSQININNNGKNYSSMNDLPPELKQKVEEAMSKIKNNPGLFNMISTFGDLAKNANQMGAMPVLSKENLKKMLSSSVNQTTTVKTISPEESQSNQRNHSFAQQNKAKQFSPTYNPVVRGDGARKFIFILALFILSGYVFFKYFVNGQFNI